MPFPRSSKRAALAVAISLGIHVAVVLGVMGSALVRLWPRAPAIEFEVSRTPPTALPLAAETPAPRPQAAPPDEEVTAEEGTKPARPRRPPRKPVADAGAPDGGAADAGQTLDAGPSSLASGDAGTGLRADGPEGARLVVRLRLDRLRQAPRSAAFAALADELLLLLPDRRRLLEGSGIDLFRDFDTLVVATPNPLDDAVTFLGVRHHLTDDALMESLGRAATGRGRPLTWERHRERPVGLRPSHAGRDDRLFVLPAPGWAVIAPGTYMQLLVPELVPGADPHAAPESWESLTGRLRGEEAVMPEDAVLMATMHALLAADAGQTITVPGAGALPVPGGMGLFVALEPAFVTTLRLQFSRAEAARAWAKEIPALQRQFSTHPVVLLSGMAGAVGRVTFEIEASPEGAADTNTLVIRFPMTSDEAERILRLITNLARGRLAR
ncbi:MAG: hypothetical protein KA712_14780 [Myxococcales bacterium]|nr:hypothetical protein [Myxococcales bacterium]